MNYNIVDNIIDYSLFTDDYKLNKHVNNNPNMFINQIPDNVFGVFVTIKRSHKLTDWPEDIHGCIGYWDKSYHIMPKQSILEHLKTVSVSATYSDDRRNYFKEDILLDLMTDYEITFMHLPIMEIDNTTGMIKTLNKPFNNTDYGIITKLQGMTSTYLPNVFPNESWNKISNSLLGKAGILLNNSNVKFYAYQTTILKKSIYEHLTNPVIKFMEKYYTNNIPYSYSNGKVFYDNDSYVRNIATMKDLLFLRTNINNHTFYEIIKANIFDYADIFIRKIHDNTITHELRQSIPFLMICLSIFGKEHDINELKKYIITQLDDIKRNSREFEYGELLVGLTYIAAKQKDEEIKNIIISEQKEIYEELANNKFDNNDDIFQLNWYAQALTMMGLYFNFNTKYNKTEYDFNNHRNILYKYILRLSKNYNQNTESNYIAVAFEALTGLLQFDSTIYFNELQHEITRLLKILHMRINHNGLVEFIDGSCRVDITGHMLSGIHHLVTNINYKNKNNNYIFNKTQYTKLKSYQA